LNNFIWSYVLDYAENPFEFKRTAIQEWENVAKEMRYKYGLQNHARMPSKTLTMPKFGTQLDHKFGTMFRA